MKKIIIILLTILVLSSCNQSPIVGTWKHIKITDIYLDECEQSIYFFKSDGKLVVEKPENCDDVNFIDLTGKWELFDDELMINIDNEQVFLKVKFGKNTMLLNAGEEDESKMIKIE